MTIHSDWLKRLFAVVFLLLARPAIGEEAANPLLARLDALDQSIAAARVETSRERATLEELRADLFQIAFAARDAKRLSDEIEQLMSAGKPGEAELAQLRNDLMNVGMKLRDLRNHIEQMDKVVVDADAKINAQHEELEALKQSIAQSPAAAPAGGVPPAAVAEAFSVQDGRDFLAAGNVAGAERQFKGVLASDSGSNEARIGLASVRFEQGDLDAAEGLIAEALKHDNRNPRALGLQGLILYRKGRLSEAKRTIERALKWDNQNAYNHYYLGIVLYELGRSEAAIKSIERAIELDPEYIPAHYNLAILYATDESPNVIASRASYERAMALGGPRNALLDQLLDIR
jgi:Tfp pilus assembly protein PilF